MALDCGPRFLLYFSLLFCLPYLSEQCSVPVEFVGDWYSMEAGKSITTNINEKTWGQMTCQNLYIHNNTHKVAGVNATMLMKKVTKDNNQNDKICFYCLDILWRTLNILQYRQSDCYTSNTGFEHMCSGIYELPSVSQVITMFRQTIKTVNCITTFEGVFQFTYEVSWGGAGICDNPDSVIEACQDPGSSYVDNEVFLMKYAKCREVQTSRTETIRYQCMGSWFAMLGGSGYTFAAIADTVQKDKRERFKCLMTLKNEKSSDNTIRWTMSRFADCRKLNTNYDGPVRLKLKRIPPLTAHMTSQCNLPRNISGEWFTQGLQFRSRVVINDTHIHYYTQKNEFEFEDMYLSCQQTLGTRFLMTKVIIGKCEVDFVCYDILPRHHGIVRYRVGKPSRLTKDEVADPNYMEKKFREACSWMSFTFNRDDTDWKYEVLILNPPSPVPCPIAGRYRFNQLVQHPLEKYMTRIRGVTDRPRVRVDCRIIVSEFKSCSQDKSKIEIDSEYCESVDYRGRPIGEYDEPDHILTCVGFWMEDMKSYLITYDEEDAISEFRCWVYERFSWTDVHMSRAQTARCPRIQNASSYLDEGTGLSMELYENERLYDDCPQRFDPGTDPYRKPTVIYVLSGATYPRNHFSLIVSLISAVTLMSRMP